MKKSNYIFIASFLVIVVFVFSAYIIKNDNPNQSLTYGGDNSLSEVEYKDLDDLIEAADNIVIGRVDEEEHSINSLYKYTFTVEQDLKGFTGADSIDVYEVYGDLSINNTYLLFLEYFDSVYYPRAVYTSIGDDSIMNLTNENLVGSKKYINDMKKNDIIKYIEKSPYINVKKEKNYNVKDNTGSIKELIDLSDYVLHIEVTSTNNVNKNINDARFNIIEQYKGNIDSNQKLSLPAYVKSGEEYIIFMKDAKYDIRLTTRNDSVISKEDVTKWNEVLNQLKK